MKFGFPEQAENVIAPPINYKGQRESGQGGQIPLSG